MLDGYFLNKCAGAVIFALLISFALSEFSATLFRPHEPDPPAYTVAVPPPAATSQQQAATIVPLPQRLADANIGKGASLSKKCVSCHSFEKGGANRIGPHLWDIVGRRIGAVDGFSYSAALSEKGSEGIKWSYDHLDDFLTSPKAYAAGTKMSFRGIRDPQQRADLIAWLRMKSDMPQSLPPESK